MSNHYEKQCRNLLKWRERGFSIADAYFAAIINHVLLLAMIFAGLFFTTMESRFTSGAGWLVIGMALGAGLRDLGWTIRIKRSWPLTVRITDWDIVRQIANLPDDLPPDSPPVEAEIVD